MQFNKSKALSAANAITSIMEMMTPQNDALPDIGIKILQSTSSNEVVFASMVKTHRARLIIVSTTQRTNLHLFLMQEEVRSHEAVMSLEEIGSAAYIIHSWLHQDDRSFPERRIAN